MAGSPPKKVLANTPKMPTGRSPCPIPEICPSGEDPPEGKPQPPAPRTSDVSQVGVGDDRLVKHIVMPGMQVIGASRAEWIVPFTGLQPGQFRKLVATYWRTN